MPPTGQDQQLQAIAAAAIEEAAIEEAALGGAGWVIADGPFWCQVEPRRHPRRLQGWKIHLSAVPDAAPEVLRRVLGPLLAERCPFKFVRSREALRESLGRGFPRAASGKFVTVYPGGDDRFAALARVLHQATSDLDGPRILSDRQYAPGSLVHYRFGGFAPLRELADSGSWQDMLVTPDGGLTPDRRVPWFAPPAWAADPLAGRREPPRPEPPAGEDTGPASQPGPGVPAGPGPRPAPADGPAGPLLQGRYAVSRAIRHTGRGGIYRGTDTADGQRVVIKQARPFADSGSLSGDARDLLRNEAAMVRRLELTGAAARLVDTFLIGPDLFVVLGELAGLDLESWILARTDRGRSLPLDDALSCCRRLVSLMDRVHGAGIVINDFSPGNVLRADDGTLWLIDLEAATAPGAPASTLMTAGFAAPERRQAHQDGVPRPASAAADRYSLGATICYLALEQNPFLRPDEVSGPRPDAQRLAGWLETAAAAGMPLAGQVGPLAAGLMAADPADRWPLARAREFLAGRPGPARPKPVRTPAPRMPLAAGEAAEAAAGPTPDGPPDLVPLIHGSLSYLLARQRPGGESQWTVDSHLGDVDPGMLSYGAAGIAAVLIRASAHPVALPPGRLAAGILAANRWNDKVLAGRTRRLLPGLYAGHAGVAWGAFDVATAAGDEVNRARARDLARSLPTDWHIPDVYHGLAGAGLALLHLWLATGDDQLGARARACADALVTTARRPGGRVCWSLEPDQETVHGHARADRAYQGFAHGTAGIALFLLLSGTTWASPTHLDTAAEAGEALARAARVEEPGPDDAQAAAWWEADGRAAGQPVGGWCQGAAGVGSFLLALWQVTGDARHRVLAGQAGAAAYRTARHAAGGACHGLAGIGHFLLDLADALGEPGWRARAGEVAGWLAVRAIRGPAGPAFAGSSAGTGPPGLSFADGMAGDLDFALRLQYGGRSPWRPDVLSGRSPAAAGAGASSGEPPR